MSLSSENPSEIIVPVILCGGSGTRLWPASRQNHPKQFLSLIGDFSLLQNTLRRALRVSGAKFSSVVIVTLDAMEEAVKTQLSEINPEAASHILCEPMARNTAAAVAFAADYVRKTFGENAIMWILPADHHIGRESALASSFQHALQSARDGNLVTFGIKPTRPDTGYGYIRTGKTDASGLAYSVERFVEKPKLETAREYLADGSYLWNSGMFVFKAGTVMNQYEALAPDIVQGVRGSVRFSDKRPSIEVYGAIKSVPFDTAIMEKSKNIAVVPCDPQWSDIGSWESLWDISDKDHNDNVLKGRAIAHNAQGCLVESKNRLIAVAGLKDIVVIETEDAVLIANKSDGDSMKQLVNALKDSGANEVIDVAKPPPQPWAMVKNLEQSLQAREIAIKPGNSKQFEAPATGACLYTAVHGTAHISVGGATKIVNAFESLNIETASPYTISNHGTEELKLIEVHRTAPEGIFFGEKRKTA